MSDNLEYEKRCIEEGYANIAGVDEVGRGPLAGPVTVCAVIMPLEQDKIIDGVTDSKKLSAKNAKNCARKYSKGQLRATWCHFLRNI